MSEERGSYGASTQRARVASDVTADERSEAAQWIRDHADEIVYGASDAVVLRLLSNRGRARRQFIARNAVRRYAIQSADESPQDHTVGGMSFFEAFDLLAEVRESLDEAMSNLTAERDATSFNIDDVPISEPFGTGKPPVLTDLANEPIAPPLEDETLLKTDDFARLMGFDSVQTVRNHIEEHKIIAWRVGAKRWAIPQEQLGPGNQYIPNLKEMLEHFSSPAAAWGWLNRRSRHTNGERPVDRLHMGETAEVLNAVSLYVNGDFT